MVAFTAMFVAVLDSGFDSYRDDRCRTSDERERVGVLKRRNKPREIDRGPGAG